MEPLLGQVVLARIILLEMCVEMEAGCGNAGLSS
jgi:hypothetical protein